MFSSKDFEKCWFLYQSEGLPYNLSIEEFCLKQGVPVNEFNKWYRDTHKRIHPIQVDGAPTSESKEETLRQKCRLFTTPSLPLDLWSLARQEPVR